MTTHVFQRSAKIKSTTTCGSKSNGIWWQRSCAAAAEPRKSATEAPPRRSQWADPPVSSGMQSK